MLIVSSAAVIMKHLKRRTGNLHVAKQKCYINNNFVTTISVRSPYGILISVQSTPNNLQAIKLKLKTICLNCLAKMLCFTMQIKKSLAFCYQGVSFQTWSEHLIGIHNFSLVFKFSLHSGIHKFIDSGVS